MQSFGSEKQAPGRTSARVGQAMERCRSESSAEGSATARWSQSSRNAVIRRPQAAASASTTVDLPVPFSPINTVTPRFRVRPCCQMCRTTGNVYGQWLAVARPRSIVIPVTGAPGCRLPTRSACQLPQTSAIGSTPGGVPAGQPEYLVQHRGCVRHLHLIPVDPHVSPLLGRHLQVLEDEVQ